MKGTDAHLSDLIRSALLLDTAAMRDVDIWPHVLQLVQSTRRRRRHHQVVLMVAVASATALVAATTVIASASADARHLVASAAESAAQVVGISIGGNGRTPAVSPNPGFHVVGPSYVPAGLDVHSIAYSPGRATNGNSWTAMYSVGPPRPSESPDPAQQRAVAESGLPTISDRFSSSKGPGYVQIIQRRQAPGDPAPAGEVVVVGTTRGYLVDQGTEMTVTLVESGVRIQVITNLGRSEAIKVAASLR